jgi:hypothetical protein
MRPISADTGHVPDTRWSEYCHAHLRVPQRTHLPATGFMTSGAVPGRLRAEGAPDRCRGAPVFSPRPAGRLRPTSFSSSAHFSHVHRRGHLGPGRLGRSLLHLSLLLLRGHLDRLGRLLLHQSHLLLHVHHMLCRAHAPAAGFGIRCVGRSHSAVSQSPAAGFLRRAQLPAEVWLGLRFGAPVRLGSSPRDGRVTHRGPDSVGLITQGWTGYPSGPRFGWGHHPGLVGLPIGAQVWLGLRIGAPVWFGHGFGAEHVVPPFCPLGS